MTYGGVFWYGLVVMVLSAIAGYATDGLIGLVFTVAVNWVFFVLPVVLIRNARNRRKARHAT